MDEFTIWKHSPEDHDYPAAQDYLELLMSKELAEHVVKELKRAEIVLKKGKDILRASQLPLVPRDNKHVIINMQKIKKGEKLSPILLLRDNDSIHSALIIADGYHRVCTAYYKSEDMEIPVKIAIL